MEEKSKKPFFFEGRKRTQIITFSLCFAIAFVFWIFNALSNDYTTVIKYPVKLLYNKKSMILSESAFKKIDIAVTGYGWKLLSLSLGFDHEPIVLTTDDLNHENMIFSSALFYKAKQTLSDVKVNQVLSEVVFYDVDKLESKSIKLALDTRKISIPAGKKIKELEISPSNIICKGPKNMIEKLPDSITFSIPDKFIEKDFNEIVEINYHPSRSVSTSENSVKVSFKLQ